MWRSTPQRTTIDGTLREMVENHLIQVLTHIAMDVPVAYDSQVVHPEKLEALRSIRPLRADDLVYGRYEAGEVGREPVLGYLEEQGEPADSTTEIFVPVPPEGLRVNPHAPGSWGPRQADDLLARDGHLWKTP